MPQWAGLFLGRLSNREDSDLQSFSSHSSLPKAKCPTVQSRERRQSMFQLRQYFPFRQELPATQEILSGAKLQPEQQGKGKKQMVQVRQGRVNFTTLAELPEGAPVMPGTFSIHNKPAVILFDSGATHSFISAKFGARVGLDY